MLHGQLKDFGLLQLGGSLLLVGGGHQALEFGERGVDPIPPLLLDHSASLLAAHQLAAARLTGRDSNGTEEMVSISYGLKLMIDLQIYR